MQPIAAAPHDARITGIGGSLVSAPAVLALALIGALAVFSEVFALVRVGVSPSYVSFSSAVAAVHGGDATWSEGGAAAGDAESSQEASPWSGASQSEPSDTSDSFTPDSADPTGASNAAAAAGDAAGEGSSAVDSLLPPSLLPSESRAGLMFDALLRAQFRVQQAVDWATEVPNSIGGEWLVKPLGSFQVDLFMEYALEKGIGDIHAIVAFPLPDGPPLPSSRASPAPSLFSSDM
ncbi:hypothetical protein CLOM_g22509 [Closterium sp. NIES-68]|nr:hypothetical protein CLOM_g22509 [Closterium sp. NIES-68]GJP59479.1 hypothetical protein CLOP_g12267 [Closterium sp. NIES-67]